jgi:hypothetical protein
LPLVTLQAFIHGYAPRLYQKKEYWVIFPLCLV